MSGAGAWQGTLAGLGRMVLRVIFCVALAFPAVAARAVIGVGEAAPQFTKTDLAGGTQMLDDRTSAAFLLVFIKPEERFTSEALTALDRVFAQQPDFARDLKRIAIISRVRAEDDLEGLKRRMKADPNWVTVLDADNKLYDAYRIVATPTVVLIGRDHRVAATHAGYDPGMAHDVRLALAQMQGITLPLSAPAEPADMQMQTARRLLALGLYDRALTYYEKAMIKGPLSPRQNLELAEIYIGLRQPGLALQTLAKIPADAPESGQILALTEKANKVQAALANGKLNPPRVQSSPATSATQIQRP